MRIKYSLKFKVTLWYTCIIALVLAITFGGAFYLSEYYSMGNMKEELLDEVGDLVKVLQENPKYLNGQELPAFYDDGIMLSIYKEDGSFVNGILPDDFPKRFPLKAGEIQELQQNEDYWFLYDYQITDKAGENWWVRGINSYSSIAMLIHRLLWLLAFLGPALVIFTALMGYQMVKKALKPIYTITDTVEDISQASDLSKRLPRPPVPDEFARLTETFNRMLERLDKSFSVEKQFTSDAAHELRTPISVILNHCEYCMDEVELSEEAREELQIIYGKAERMSKLITQLLIMAQAENHTYQLKLEPIDLAVLAESVIEELEEKASKKGIRLILKNRLSDSAVEGDMVLLTRLLMNLADNAVAYGREGGYAEISLEKAGDQICIRVKDNGIGIPGDEIGKIWNRFYRGDKSRTQSQGFGLGLFMVRWIVEQHGGTIEVESEYGRGTVFTVLIS